MQKEDEILLDYDWDSGVDRPITGYSTSDGYNYHSNFLSNGPVQDVPTARGSTVVTSMGLTSCGAMLVLSSLSAAVARASNTLAL